MSNLLKQYNTVEPEKSRRMIDYNSMVEKKLAELVKKQKKGNAADGDGFQSLDLAAANVVKEDPEEVLQAAKDEAAEILKSAKDKSENIISSAKNQSGEIFQKAKEDGHKEGYDEGYRQAKGKLEAEYQARNEELNRLEQKLQDDYKQEMEELEPKLLDVILTVVEKVFQIQFGDKREILLYLIGNAIAEIEGCKSFCIRVGDGQKEFLESHKDEILDRIGHDMSLEIVSDVSLEANQCVIETDTGIFDCSVDVQLKNLIKDLKSLRG